MLRPTFPLRTERLLLRPFRDEDLDGLLAMQGRADVTRYLNWGPRTRDEARHMLERLMRMTAIDDHSSGLRLAATLPASGEVIGDFSLWRVSQEHNQGEIGFVVHPDHHGAGYGTEGAALLLRLGFEEAGLHRIVGRCDARNAASARLMQKLGMRLEAHLRENELIKGEWCDELIFAMLASEWSDQASEAAPRSWSQSRSS
jgi:RimJ/RimL family protein N-acetyltransferase